MLLIPYTFSFYRWPSRLCLTQLSTRECYRQFSTIITSLSQNSRHSMQTCIHKQVERPSKINNVQRLHCSFAKQTFQLIKTLTVPSLTISHCHKITMTNALKNTTNIRQWVRIITDETIHITVIDGQANAVTTFLSFKNTDQRTSHWAMRRSYNSVVQHLLYLPVYFRFKPFRKPDRHANVLVWNPEPKVSNV